MIKTILVYFYRCSCGKCTPFEKNEECVCCQEIVKVMGKMKESSVQCITKHSDFPHVVLNPSVLETAYYMFKDKHGPLHMTHNEYV